jgi:hypothetical protein
MKQAAVCSDTQRGIHHSHLRARAAQHSSPVTEDKTQLNHPQKTITSFRIISTNSFFFKHE